MAETHRIHSLVEYFLQNKEKEDVFYGRMHSPTEYFLTKQGKQEWPRPIEYILP